MRGGGRSGRLRWPGTRVSICAWCSGCRRASRRASGSPTRRRDTLLSLAGSDVAAEGPRDRATPRIACAVRAVPRGPLGAVAVSRAAILSGESASGQLADDGLDGAGAGNHGAAVGRSCGSGSILVETGLFAAFWPENARLVGAATIRYNSRMSRGIAILLIAAISVLSARLCGGACGGSRCVERLGRALQLLLRASGGERPRLVSQRIGIHRVPVTLASVSAAVRWWTMRGRRLLLSIGAGRCRSFRWRLLPRKFTKPNISSSLLRLGRTWE